MVFRIWEGAAFERTEIYLKLKDVKNTFIFPMTSPGKLNEVENYEKDDKLNDWKSMASFIVGLGTVQTLKSN